MQADREFDLIVLGSGPGGYVAAIKSAQLGFKTAIVERESLGGVCLNWGCIPTKALLKSSEVYNTIKNARKYGIIVENVSYDFNAIIERSRGVANTLSAGIKHLMKKNNIEVIHGHGKLLGDNLLAVQQESAELKLKARHIIIATGARARELPGMSADGKHIWTYREALLPESMPKSLLIIGSGAIGVEFASFYNAFGVEVTMLELHEHILKTEDHEIADLVAKSLTDRGVKIRTLAQLKSHVNTPEGNMVEIDINGVVESHMVDRIISAVGVVPNIENIGLENTKVQLDRGHIKVDEYQNTDENGVYAIGDVVSPPWLAHKASHEAIVCVEKIAGLSPSPLDHRNIPGCIYCQPEVASVGITEKYAQEHNMDVKIGRFPFTASGKATASGDTEGMVKTIFDSKTGELLGAHLVGHNVTELINGFVIGKTMEATEEDFIKAVFPHPTLSEMMQESTLAAYEKAIHI